MGALGLGRNSILSAILFNCQVLFLSKMVKSCAKDSPGVEAGIALAADHLVAVVFLSQDLERWLNHTTTQPQHQVEGGLCRRMVF